MYKHYKLIQKGTLLQDLVGKMYGQVVSFDLETDSLNEREANIVGIGLCAKPGEAYYVPTAHNGVANVPLPQALDILRPIFRGPIIGQNLKYDSKVLRRYGITLSNIIFDTMIASYLLDADKRGFHNLDALSKRYLGHETIKFKDIVPKKGTFADCNIYDALKYAGEDVDVVMRLFPVLVDLLEQKGLSSLYYDVDLPLSIVLLDMEWTGVALNPLVLSGLNKSFSIKLEEAKHTIYEMAGEVFNIASTQQLSGVLYDKMGMKCPKVTAKGARSTSSEVLEKIPKKHAIVEHILQFRKAQKMKSAFLDKLPEHMSKDGRIHPSFNQCITLTGRLSCSNPNLQQIPSRDEEGKEIRKAFQSKEGHSLVGADYSQIELRMFAHYSNDPILIDAYQTGKDIHQITADLVGSTRDQAKTINFGILYGMGGYRLANTLGVSSREGYRFLDNFFNEYAGASSFIEQWKRMCRAEGASHTYLGRRATLPTLKHPDEKKRAGAERQAVSVAIQGSAADLMKVAMLNIYDRLNKEGLKSKMVLQVHDEINLECPDDEVEHIKILVKEEMENVWDLKVPLVADVKSGKDWGDVH